MIHHTNRIYNRVLFYKLAGSPTCSSLARIFSRLSSRSRRDGKQRSGFGNIPKPNMAWTTPAAHARSNVPSGPRVPAWISAAANSVDFMTFCVVPLGKNARICGAGHSRPRTHRLCCRTKYSHALKFLPKMPKSPGDGGCSIVWWSRCVWFCAAFRPSPARGPPPGPWPLPDSLQI